MDWKQVFKPTKGKFIILIILLLIIGLFFLIIFNYTSTTTDGIGWNKKCQSSSNCAFVEKVNVPVPGPEGCYSIKENPVIQNENLISIREECECINNVCQVKID